jgi:dTDP-4-dehydrorhamnose reductase
MALKKPTSGLTPIMIMPSATKANGSRPTLAVLGANGTLGADLVDFLGVHYAMTGITRENYDEHRGTSFDVFVNANGNSRRFWAIEHPLEDFEASTLSVYKSLFDFKFKKYIYISSSDVYNDHANPAHTKEDAAIDPLALSSYGLNKFLAELAVKHQAKSWVVLRSSMILGGHLKKGPFYDILNSRPLFITLDSRLQMITTRAIADVVAAVAGKSVNREVFNMGGKGTFAFKDLGRYFEQSVAIDPKAETQTYEMNVEKLADVISLKTSEEYLKDFINGNPKQKI